MQKENERHFAAMRENTRTAVRTPPGIMLPEPPKMADRFFIDGTCRLIEILVGTDQKAEALKIRDQALELLDDPRLKTAVEDAEARVKQRLRS